MPPSRRHPPRSDDPIGPPPPTPDAILRLPDSDLRTAGIEAWEAASRLIRALDVAEQWYADLFYTAHPDDYTGPDPGILTRCLESAARAIRTLAAYGVRSEPFDRRAADEIMLMLPPEPSWTPGGKRVRWDEWTRELVEYEEAPWWDDPEFWTRYHEPFGERDRTGRTARMLRGFTFQLRERLRYYPASVLGGSGPHDDRQQLNQSDSAVRVNATALNRTNGRNAAKPLSDIEQSAVRLWESGEYHSYKEVADAMKQDGHTITAKRIAQIMNRLQQRKSRNKRRRGTDAA